MGSLFSYFDSYCLQNKYNFTSLSFTLKSPIINIFSYFCNKHQFHWIASYWRWHVYLQFIWIIWATKKSYTISNAYLHKKCLASVWVFIMYLFVLMLYGFWYKEEFHHHLFFNLVLTVYRNLVLKIEKQEKGHEVLSP